MGKLLIVNGSPRAPRSNSRRYIEQFLPCWGETADQYTALRGGPLSPEDCTDLLLVFPLYADGIPAVLMRTLKELAEDCRHQRQDLDNSLYRSDSSW